MTTKITKLRIIQYFQYYKIAHINNLKYILTNLKYTWIKQGQTKMRKKKETDIPRKCKVTVTRIGCISKVLMRKTTNQMNINRKIIQQTK